MNQMKILKKIKFKDDKIKIRGRGLYSHQIMLFFGNKIESKKQKKWQLYFLINSN
jgi:hypothetical protein